VAFFGGESDSHNLLNERGRIGNGSVKGLCQRMLPELFSPARRTLAEALGQWFWMCCD
jgi:hypothetical protein